jgi:CheY-like chemotaxis protein
VPSRIGAGGLLGKWVCMAQKRLYCPSCGVEVDGYAVLQAGVELNHCPICGLVIPDENKPEASIELLKCVAIAEDSESLRHMLEKMLIQQKIAKEVVSAKNGVEFVSLVSKRMRDNLPVSLALLDVEMPVMNGVQAAATLREVEKSLGQQRKTPVLFFTSRPCDERFKAVLKQIEPSSYVNKGQSPDPVELARRVYKVLQILFKGAAQPS